MSQSAGETQSRSSSFYHLLQNYEIDWNFNALTIVACT